MTTADNAHAPSVHVIGHLHQRLRLGGEAAAGPLRARLEAGIIDDHSGCLLYTSRCV